MKASYRQLDDHRVRAWGNVAEGGSLLGHDAAGHGDRGSGVFHSFQLVELRVNRDPPSLPHDAGVEDGDVGRRASPDVTGGQELSREALRVGGVHLQPIVQM